MTTNLTGIAATLTELATLSVGLILFKKAGKPFRLLIFWLLIGCVTDLICWKTYKTNLQVAYRLLDAYSLFESLFLIYIIQSTGFIKNQNHLFRIIYSFIAVLFFCSYYLFPYWMKSEDSYSGLFSFIYLTTSVCLSTWALLNLIETVEVVRESPDFFLLMGIFVFCFCSFFIDSFINDEFKASVWWLHDVANMTAYLIFIYAFFLLHNGGVEKDLH